MHYINCILFSKSDDEDMDSDEEDIAGIRDVSCVFCFPLFLHYNFLVFVVHCFIRGADSETRSRLPT